MLPLWELSCQLCERRLILATLSRSKIDETNSPVKIVQVNMVGPQTFEGLLKRGLDVGWVTFHKLARWWVEAEFSGQKYFITFSGALEPV